MTIEFYARLMCEYYDRLLSSVKESIKAIEDIELATEALEKSMPLEKKSLSGKNFLASCDEDGDPFVYAYIESMKNLTSNEKKRLAGLETILMLLSLPVEEARDE